MQCDTKRLEMAREQETDDVESGGERRGSRSSDEERVKWECEEMGDGCWVMGRRWTASVEVLSVHPASFDDPTHRFLHARALLLAPAR